MNATLAQSGSVKPRLRSLNAGQLLCTYGDPPGPLYVVVSGRLLVFRPNPDRLNVNVELARLGPGAIVGELAAVLGTPRTASVAALEDTRVLEVPVDQLADLTRQHAPFIRILVDALHERAGLSGTQIREVIATWGVDVPDFGDLHAKRSSSTAPTIVRPPHDPAWFYAKSVTCPLCQKPFSVRIVRSQADQPVQRESDFHQIYLPAFNPYDYELWVCPTDLYTALPADFGPLPISQRGRVAAAINEVVGREWGTGRPEFGGDRSLELREHALQLALAIYRARSTSALRIAALLHRRAWCARESDDLVAEQAWLTEALTAYSAAHEHADAASDKEDLRIQYLCGELALRLGDRTTAHRWFANGLLHPAIDKHAMWARMLRDQLSTTLQAANPPDGGRVIP